ncbi:non-histone chromosomal protein HMG-14 [Manacus vitellinus]|uniref:non-histone chromosomal protein HMG-14 n=1 Tax=Manacus vitellinus TaxID=328815 RepID=UPI00115CC7A0|nr:non-histone chromosomal protein HMG-14 [Manacus vitellinus]
MPFPGLQPLSKSIWVFCAFYYFQSLPGKSWEFTHWKCISLQDKSEDKKAQKGKKGPKGKQTEETNQEQTKDNLPAENGEAKTEETPAPDAAAEKEVKSE